MFTPTKSQGFRFDNPPRILNLKVLEFEITYKPIEF